MRREFRRLWMIGRMLWISEARWLDSLRFAVWIATRPAEEFDEMYARERRMMETFRKP